MRTPRTIALLFLSIIWAGGPVAAFAQKVIPSGPKPAWVDTQPADDDTNMYFVGFGFSAQSDPREAQQFAIDDILGQIVRFLDVKITSETTSAAVGDLDEFKTSISRQVTETSGARLTGFRVAGKWSEKNSRGVTVFVLVSYETAAILKEKQRLEAVFQSQLDAVKIPEAEATQLAAAGAYYQAVCRYIDAAVAAAESTLEDGPVALNRTLARAMETLEQISLLKLNDNLTGTAGASAGDAFRLKVAAGPTASAKGVPRAAVIITYYESRGGADLIAKTTVVQSDDQGIIAFNHPELTFVGKGKVGMLLDLSAYLEKLKNAEKKSGEKVRALRKLALSKKQEFNVTSLSRARTLLHTIFIVDMEDNGRPLKTNQTTAGGVKESLARQGFTLKTASLNPSLAADTNEAELARLLARNVPGAARAIVGTAAVANVSRDQGRFIVKASASVKVIDLKSGHVLFQQQLQKTYTGASLEAARTAAFKQLGRELGVRIAVGTN